MCGVCVMFVALWCACCVCDVWSVCGVVFGVCLFVLVCVVDCVRFVWFMLVVWFELCWCVL